MTKKKVNKKRKKLESEESVSLQSSVYSAINEVSERNNSHLDIETSADKDGPKEAHISSSNEMLIDDAKQDFLPALRRECTKISVKNNPNKKTSKDKALLKASRLATTGNIRRTNAKQAKIALEEFKFSLKEVESNSSLKTESALDNSSISSHDLSDISRNRESKKSK